MDPEEDEETRADSGDKPAVDGNRGLADELYDCTHGFFLWYAGVGRDWLVSLRRWQTGYQIGAAEHKGKRRRRYGAAENGKNTPRRNLSTNR